MSYDPDFIPMTPAGPPIGVTANGTAVVLDPDVQAVCRSAMEDSVHMGNAALALRRWSSRNNWIDRKVTAFVIGFLNARARAVAHFSHELERRARNTDVTRKDATT